MQMSSLWVKVGGGVRFRVVVVVSSLLGLGLGSIIVKAIIVLRSLFFFYHGPMPEYETRNTECSLGPSFGYEY